MKILLLHEIKEWMLDVDLSVYDLITFDDGLYSQYQHLEHFLKFKKPIIFFIAANMVCEENHIQNNEIVSCVQARQEFLNGNKSNYMKWSQINEIKNIIEIGGHGFNHIKNIYKYKDIRDDTNLMIQKFESQEIFIKSFAYPFFIETFMYKLYLQSIGIKNLYGNERLEIEREFNRLPSYI